MTANLSEDFGDSPSVEEVFPADDEVRWEEINEWEESLDKSLPRFHSCGVLGFIPLPDESNDTLGRLVTEEYLQYVDGVVTNWLAHNDV